MEVDLTQIMVILVTLVSAVMTGILFPLIRSKVSAAQWELIKEFAVAGVQAAEIIFNAQGKGEEKLEWVTEYIEKQCKAHGIEIDMDTVRVAIENAWKDLGLDKKHAEISAS
ncbi:MAG: phage holin [Negativibacillus sp.]